MSQAAIREENGNAMVVDPKAAARLGRALANPEEVVGQQCAPSQRQTLQAESSDVYYGSVAGSRHRRLRSTQPSEPLATAGAESGARQGP